SNEPSSVTAAWRLTGTSGASLPGWAGNVVSIGASSSSSSLSSASSTNWPTASARRTEEEKKRNWVGSPTTRPNSIGGTSAWVPSSIPNGATQSALTGGSIPGTAGLGDSPPTE